MSGSWIFLSSDSSNKENNGAKLMVLVISCAVCLAIFMIILFGRRLLCCWRPHRHITAASSTPHDSPEPRLAPSTVAALPTFAYQRAIDCSGKDNGTSVQCAVCLGLAREGEMVRLLPKCKHVFHAECIDMWLHSHSTCPLCRSDVADSPNLGEKVEAGQAMMAPPALPV